MSKFLRRRFSASAAEKMSRPPKGAKLARPAEGSASKARHPATVLLPDPDSPTMPSTSPGPTSKETSAQATTAPQWMQVLVCSPGPVAFTQCSQPRP